MSSVNSRNIKSVATFTTYRKNANKILSGFIKSGKIPKDNKHL